MNAMSPAVSMLMYSHCSPGWLVRQPKSQFELGLHVVEGIDAWPGSLPAREKL
jgi:hypothetical protein